MPDGQNGAWTFCSMFANIPLVIFLCFGHFLLKWQNSVGNCTFLLINVKINTSVITVYTGVIC